MVTDESVNRRNTMCCSATLCGRHLHKNLAFVSGSPVYTEAVICNVDWYWMHTS